MNILIVNNSLIPALQYGGTERVIWDLAKELSSLGHKIGFLVKNGSSCPYADIFPINQKLKLTDQIPPGYDIVHFNFQIDSKPNIPYLITQHGNASYGEILDNNTVFVSENHAHRHQSNCFVYNGLDWSVYGKIDFEKERKDLHFLAKAAWKIKNVKDALSLAKESHNKIHILGGYRINFNMGFRLTTSLNSRFYGMVGLEKKLEVFKKSKALVFPVLWDEPFGLAIIESLYCGCRVYGSSFGSIPELIDRREFGGHADNYGELLELIKNCPNTASKMASEYAGDCFNAGIMTQQYIKLYEKVLNGNILNEQNPQLKEKAENKQGYFSRLK